eukprot:gnl/Trimastix_PCT/37.p1 GENE.gnl/Trimastix_PCT/37~~gnl/Trimastix_PCT/37.p1  ORF type:complete len:258 (+),score=79.59 gnl/Trimastix_PCT/37:63-836(+)
MASQMNKKRKFVADGIFFAELNSFLLKELGDDGYAGVELRVIPARTEITIRATRTQRVLGEKGRRIRELTALIQKRFNFPENSIRLLAERMPNRGLSAVAQCEALCFKLIGGLPVRRACYGVLRFIMDSGAKGCEVIVSGKLRAQRAKAMKFGDGYMLKVGDPTRHLVEKATRHVVLEQGMLGIKVAIMHPTLSEHPQGKNYIQPDVVTIRDPKADEIIAQEALQITSISHQQPAPPAAPAPAEEQPAPEPVAQTEA